MIRLLEKLLPSVATFDYRNNVIYSNGKPNPFVVMDRATNYFKDIYRSFVVMDRASNRYLVNVYIISMATFLPILLN